MSHHQHRQRQKMTRTKQPSNDRCSFGEAIKTFADHVLRDTGAARTIAISPLVWTIDNGCDTRNWYFLVASAGSDGKFRIDNFHCRNDRNLAERSRIALMVEFVSRRPIVIHEFDDELRFAKFCEVAWPCERTTRIRIDVERERAEDPRIGQPG